MYDVIIIGGGPGGYKCAELLAKEGKSIVLIEKENLGGTCLNQGCIPFKTYLHFSKTRREILSSEKINAFENDVKCTLNQEGILNYKNSVVSVLRQGIESSLKALGVKTVQGEAKVKEETENSVIVSVNNETFEASYLVIATGSKEKTVSVPDNLNYKVIYSKDMLELKTLPKSIDIIGAGAIGLEAASFFADAGSEVAVFDVLDHIGGNIDLEISKSLQRILQKKGIKVYTGTKLSGFKKDCVIYEQNEDSFERNPSMVLIAIGRDANLYEDDLRLLNIEYTKQGIETDSTEKTNNSKVYACGDVTGKIMLAHSAYREAKVISDSVCGKENNMDYSVIPRIIYTNPEVLSIGKTEEECKNIEYTVKSLPMTYSGKYFAENGNDGAKAKLLLDKDEKVIGFHMIGNAGSEISLAAELIIQNKASLDDLKNLIYAHPTYGEIIGEIANL